MSRSLHDDTRWFYSEEGFNIFVLTSKTVLESLVWTVFLRKENKYKAKKRAREERRRMARNCIRIREEKKRQHIYTSIVRVLSS
jgi:hypothetical protein